MRTTMIYICAKHENIFCFGHNIAEFSKCAQIGLIKSEW